MWDERSMLETLVVPAIVGHLDFKILFVFNNFLHFYIKCFMELKMVCKYRTDIVKFCNLILLAGFKDVGWSTWTYLSKAGVEPVNTGGDM